jgi:hypothetical protein
MDFKSIVAKINELNDPVINVKAPSLPAAPVLNEDAQIRVLAGLTTIKQEVLTEAKKTEAKKEEPKKTEAKKEKEVSEATGFRASGKKKGEVEKSTRKQYFVKLEKDGASKGMTIVADDGESQQEVRDRAARDARSGGWTVASIRVKGDVDESFYNKFDKMVEAKKKEKTEKKVSEAKDKCTCETKGKTKCAVHGKMNEAAKPDYLDMDKDGNKKETMKKAVADKKTGKPKKGVNPFAKKNESAMMPKGKKRPVKESIEQKLTFKDMIKLVKESGGQQQIDPVDQELFAWAQRVAAAKFNESAKQEVYAGLVYERMGGVFEMFDVLAETK